jgi:hypothetical protein
LGKDWGKLRKGIDRNTPGTDRSVPKRRIVTHNQLIASKISSPLLIVLPSKGFQRGSFGKSSYILIDKAGGLTENQIDLFKNNKMFKKMGEPKMTIDWAYLRNG